MISFDFEYYRPKSASEAISTYNNIKSQGKKAIYYSGGTEIICMARMNAIRFDAVIDIKEIPECNVLEFQNNTIVIGAAVTLTRISESNLFPFLSTAAKAAADHTSRNKITIGGNICGTIPYHEALLPFLVCDSKIVIEGQSGEEIVPSAQILNRKPEFDKGELILQILTDKSYLDMPYQFIKRTKMEEIDYPLLTIAMIWKDDRIRAAFSGVCNLPFRSLSIEDDLNDKNVDLAQRINNVITHLPGEIVSNLQGSSEYRDFVLRNILFDILNKAEDAL